MPSYRSVLRHFNDNHEGAAYSAVNGAQESILITYSYCKQLHRLQSGVEIQVVFYNTTPKHESHHIRICISQICWL